MKRALLVSLVALVCVALFATSASAYSYSYGLAPTNAYSYGPYAREPAFTAWETRPEGFGMVRQTTPYPRTAPRVENHLFIGHTSTWDRSNVAYSSLSNTIRTPPLMRPHSNYAPATSYRPYYEQQPLRVRTYSPYSLGWSTGGRK